MLTEAQKYMIIGLSLLGVEKDAIVGIVSALPNPEQQDDLMEWMCDHREATTAQILKQVANIANQKEKDIH